MSETNVIPLPKFDLFGTAPLQNTIRERKVTKYLPLAPIESSDIIEFVIPSATDEYIDLSESTINVKFTVTADKVEKWTDISTVNYMIGSLFKSVDLMIGDKQVTLSPQTYSYRAYFDALLNLGKNAQDSWLQAGAFDSSELDIDFDKRDKVIHARIKDYIPNPATGLESKEIQLKGKLHLDLAFQTRAILGGCTLKLRLQLNDPSFCCMAQEQQVTPGFRLKECSLSVLQLKVYEHIFEAQQKALISSPARYPITRTEVKPMTIPANLSQVILDNVIIGRLPRKLYIALVDNAAYLGKRSLNPFKFHHYDLNFLACYVNGVQFPSIAYKPDFDNKQYIDEYYELMLVSDNINSLLQTPLTRKNYATGNTIFGFNFTSDYSDGYNMTGHNSKPQEGVLRIEIRFKKPLPSTTTALLYCEYDNEIFINADRNAFTDYN